MNREDLAWAAGFFEGEGCWSYRRSSSGSTKARATLHSTDEDVVRRFSAIVGIGKVRGPYGPHGTGTKPYWSWSISGLEPTQALLAMLWPWLGDRRRTRAVEVVTRDNAKKPGRPWKNTLYIWTDGSARPTNPGPAGIGVVAKYEGGRVAFEISEYVGRCTNNVSEYLAVGAALRRAIDIGAKDVILHTDSALVAKQYHGEWECRDESLQPLLGRLRGFAKRFDSIDIRWIPREKNREADGLSVAGAYAPRPCGACGHDWHFDSFCTAPGDEPGVACACPHGFRGGLEA